MYLLHDFIVSIENLSHNRITLSHRMALSHKAYGVPYS